MRIWNGRKKDDGSIHALGNGQLCVYEQGPDIIQIFGPPYSAPSLMQIMFPEVNQADQPLEVRSNRRPGTAVWDHLVLSDGHEFADMTDFAAADLNCFVRTCSTGNPFELNLTWVNSVQVTDNSMQYRNSIFSSGLLLYHPAGAHFYNDYPFPQKIYYQILVSGEAELIVRSDCSAGILVQSGESTIYVIGGPGYPECRLNTDQIWRGDAVKICEQTEQWWLDFSRRRHASLALPDPLPADSNSLLSIIDSVAVLIKTQQSTEGGILAGHNYHMAYVRDQYGVFRCLLKMGYYAEAKAILLFYWHTWQDAGKICNAQSMGVRAMFHVHENDDVEITGYIVLQTLMYVELTGDQAFAGEIMPMLMWAFQAQKKHLVHGMLPFNGDETYIAGGMLPRSTLHHGSAEATLLFITGADKLLAWLEKYPQDIWPAAAIEQEKQLIAETRQVFSLNFLNGSRLMTNNPQRQKWIDLPRFRHGVCEGCLEKPAAARPMLFGWTEKNEHDRYLCPACLAENNLNRAENNICYLQSVSLVPLYIQTDVLTRDQISALVQPIIDQYRATGRLPSRPDGHSTVGYDYGLLLYTLTELKHPLADQIYQKMISVVDQTGAWVEYYIDDQPQSTRYRPWESGINIEAAIHYFVEEKL